MKSQRTQKLREMFNASKSIAPQLPIMFSNNISWLSITIGCSRCKEDIPDDHVRGPVTSLIHSVVTVEGVAFCRKCLLLHHVLHRFRADGSVEFIRDGKWVRTNCREEGWAKRLVNKARNIVRKANLFFNKDRCL